MRLWSLHPSMLDAKGFIALWREALLARKVLEGNTRGYKNHPQLIRFRESVSPLNAINSYLQVVYEESCKRNYRFSKKKIKKTDSSIMIPVTNGQVMFEYRHLLNKLQNRNPQYYDKIKKMEKPVIHPLFKEVKGTIEKWEKI